MIFLVTNNSQAPWQDMFLANYTHHLTKTAGVPYMVMPYRNFMQNTSITSNDLVWIMHHDDIENVALKARGHGAKTCFFMSSTCYGHPWCLNMYAEDEADCYKYLDYLFAPTEVAARMVKDITPNTTVIVTGECSYIKQPNPLLQPKERVNRCVVAGRLGVEKQPLLAMYLLYPFLKDGFFDEVVFCYPYEDDEWYLEEMYGGKERWEKLGFQFKRMERQEWLEYAKESRWYFTASLADTLCSSAYEAIASGCLPVIPRTVTGTQMPSIYEQLNTPSLLKFSYTPYSLTCIAKVFSVLGDDYITQGKTHNPYAIMAHANPAFNFFDTLRRNLPVYFDANHGKTEQPSLIHSRFNKVD